MEFRRAIFFDVTELCLHNKGTGIQRVTRSVLQTLLRVLPLGWDVIPVRGDNTQGMFFEVSIFGSMMEFQLEKRVISPRPGDVFLSVDLSYNISMKLKEELVRFRNIGVGIYFVVHDLIPILYSHWFVGKNEWFEGNDYLSRFNFWLDCAVSTANGMICISKSVENDVRDWLVHHPPSNNNLPKLGYFHLGSNIEEGVSSIGIPSDGVNILEKIRSSQSFLMVGTLEPRKCHELALDAFERLWGCGSEIALVIVGRAGWNVEPLIQRLHNHPQNGKHLFWLEGISDEYLCHVYEASSALLALSEAEGFGLPLIEAAHFQIPVIARDIPVFHEICGDGAFYFTGSNSIDLSLLLVRWGEMVEKGCLPSSNKILNLAWEESTKQLMGVVGKMIGTDFVWVE